QRGAFGEVHELRGVGSARGVPAVCADLVRCVHLGALGQSAQRCPAGGVPAGPLSLQELGRVIQEHGVTTLWLTAALFHQMVDEQIGCLQGVRQLLTGGETLSVSHVRRMLEMVGKNRLINGYGPTENTTFTCCHVMTAQSRIDQTVPIGRPISNTRVYVLDHHMQPVPIGVYGELCIGGDGLAREYLLQPELSAQKFVPDPFSGEAGARLY